MEGRKSRQNVSTKINIDKNIFIFVFWGLFLINNADVFILVSRAGFATMFDVAQNDHATTYAY